MSTLTTLPPALARYVLKPVTGQRHQLRVHMNALGLPLVGDQFYPVVKRAADEPETISGCAFAASGKNDCFHRSTDERRRSFESCRALE
jgi:tRNA pseudouridine32 synthase/23S rRNA pseudouridine746 synthase